MGKTTLIDSLPNTFYKAPELKGLGRFISFERNNLEGCFERVNEVFEKEKIRTNIIKKFANDDQIVILDRSLLTLLSFEYSKEVMGESNLYKYILDKWLQAEQDGMILIPRKILHLEMSRIQREERRQRRVYDDVVDFLKDDRVIEIQNSFIKNCRDLQLDFIYNSIDTSGLSANQVRTIFLDKVIS